jgi:hypothetical protein
VIPTLTLSLALLASPAAGLCPAPPSVGAVCSPSDDSALRERIALLMGAIDRPVSVEQWRRLPPEARARLEAIASDSSAYPTDRARALEGLVALGADGVVHRRLAQDPAAPFMVRDSAVRGLPAIVPADRAESDLGALLTSDPDLKIRASAADALVRSSPSRGCGTVRVQVGREGMDRRRAFQRALTACGDR